MAEIKINEGRDAPAFQEYAASMMSRFEYRALSLASRGLLYTLRLECWVNQKLPSDPIILSKVLGLESKEVTALLPELTAIFVIEGAWLHSPDLEDYRDKVQDRRNRQSEGGKESRRRVKAKLEFASNNGLEVSSNQVSSSLQVLRQDKINSNKSKPAYRDRYSVDEYLDPDVPF